MAENGIPTVQRLVLLARCPAQKMMVEAVCKHVGGEHKRVIGMVRVDRQSFHYDVQRKLLREIRSDDNLAPQNLLGRDAEGRVLLDCRLADNSAKAASSNSRKSGASTLSLRMSISARFRPLSIR